MTAQQVYQEVGSSHDVIAAMIRAERNGQAIAHGAVIIHDGYAPGASRHDASTSLYKIRW